MAERHGWDVERPVTHVLVKLSASHLFDGISVHELMGLAVEVGDFHPEFLDDASCRVGAVVFIRHAAVTGEERGTFAGDAYLGI